MGLKESGLRGSLRNVSVGIDAIPDGALLYYRFDDDSDTTIAIDDIGDNDGSIDGATYDSDSLAGSNALRFGGSDRVSLPLQPLPSDGDFTAIFGVNYDDEDDNQRLFSNNDGQTGRFDFQGVREGDPNPRLFSDQGPDFQSTVAIPTDQYAIVALRRDGDDWDIIVGTEGDVSVGASTTNSGTLDTSVNADIGNNPSGDGGGSRALIDEVFIAESALSISDIEDYPY